MITKFSKNLINRPWYDVLLSIIDNCWAILERSELLHGEVTPHQSHLRLTATRAPMLDLGVLYHNYLRITSAYVLCLNFYTKKSVPKILPAQQHPITRHCFKTCLLRIANTTENIQIKFLFAIFDTHLKKKKEKSGRPPIWRDWGRALNIDQVFFTWSDMLFCIYVYIVIPSRH